ncbi:hypothetical protein [Histidinibacterium lentulum]|nr:hypothetical protein [Histidinibacterium lentulum]
MPADFSDNLRALSRLMEQWSGTPLDSAGVLRRLNPGGSRTPLFWIFNSKREPERLAAALGPDQPLIYGRSLHMIVPEASLKLDVGRRLAAHYADALRPAVGDGLLCVGANCQGTSIAMEVVRRLNRERPVVPALAFINARPGDRLDLPKLLFYGEEDPQSDPFREDPDAASRGFGPHRREVLSGVSHGGYFEVGTVERVAAGLRSYFDEVESASAMRNDARSPTTG